MKINNLLVLIIVLAVTALSQNRVTPNVLSGFNFSQSSIDRNFNSNTFVIGWNWGSKNRSIDESLNINTHHHSFQDFENIANWREYSTSVPVYQNNSASYTNGLRSNAVIPFRYGGRKKEEEFSGLGLYLEPALTVDSTHNFIPNSEADEGAVFGYLNKSLGSNTTITDGSNTYGCFRLSAISLTGSSATVLNNAWRGDVLRYLNHSTLIASQTWSSTYFLSINLRSTNTFDNTVPDDTPIIRLRMPYKSRRTVEWDRYSDRNGYIKFRHFPRYTSNLAEGIFEIYGSNTFGSSTLSDYRGTSRTTSDQISNSSIFEITKGMLMRANSSSINDFITLSAEFKCSDERNLSNSFSSSTYNTCGISTGSTFGYEHIHNPFFVNEGVSRENPNGAVNNQFVLDEYYLIHKIDVEVEYLGGIDVDLNWIRIETPNLQKIMRGGYDDYMLAGLNEVFDGYYNNSTLNPEGHKLYRFYSFDEVTGSEYEPFRYCNSILDKLLSTETFIKNGSHIGEDNYLPHLYYATRTNELYNGSTHGVSNSPAPYIKNTDANKRTLTATAPYVEIIGKHENTVRCLGNPQGYTSKLGYLYNYRLSNNPSSTFLYTGHNLSIDYMTGSASRSYSLYETFASQDFAYCINNTNEWETPFSLNPFRRTHNDFISHKRTELPGVQQNIEHWLLSNMYKNPKMYYDYKIQSNVWLTPYQDLATLTRDVGYNEVLPASDLYLRMGRVKTAEEIRYGIDSDLIKGVKGLYFWFKHSNTFVHNYTSGSSTLTTPYIFPETLALFRNEGSGAINITSPDDLYSDNLGGDFIMTQNDPNYLHTYFSSHTISGSSNSYNFEKLGIKPTRVYTGIKSLRTELYKKLSWIKACEPDIMKFDLMAYKNKGFVSFSNSRSSSFTDLGLNFTNYFDTSNIKTRPIGRYMNSHTVSPGIWVTVPDYEQSKTVTVFDNYEISSNSITTVTGIDSAFYEVSLLKHQDKSLEDEIYLGVVNRRTDPLLDFTEVYINGSNTITDTDFKFYSSAEFDEKVRSNTFTHSYNTSSSISGTITFWDNGQSMSYTSPYPQEMWKKLWWKRLGAREIRIPVNLNNIKSLSGGGFANEAKTTVKVTELGVGTSMENEWWWSKDLRHNVDTLVGNSSSSNTCSIVVRLLPGEGKILKIRILRDESNIVGSLEHINQRKLIAFNSSNTLTMRDESVPNSVRYHLVYTKLMPKNSTTLSTVMYKRSHPMDRNVNDDSQVINWEEDEHILSHDFRDLVDPTLGCGNTLTSTFTTNANCGYPTLVVRVDSTLSPPKPKLYVVYSCAGYNEPTNAIGVCLRVVENVLYANENIGAQDLSGNTLAYVPSPNHNDIKNYGHLGINASYLGNFYSWNSEDGIHVAFKKPNQLCFQNTMLIPNYTSTTYSSTFSQPNLNSYSRINYLESDAGLAWKEKNSATLNHILYTRVWYKDGVGLYSQLAPSGNTCWGAMHETFGYYQGNSNILFTMRHDYQPDRQYPIVYRNIATIPLSNTISYSGAHRSRKSDFIVWEGKDWDNNKSIYHGIIDNYDNFSVPGIYDLPGCIQPMYSANIRDLNHNIVNPSFAQGKLRPVITGTSTSYTDLYNINEFDNRIADLNFVEEGSNNLWHIPNGIHSLWSGWNYLLGNYEDFPLSMQVNAVSSGTITLPKLAAQPILISDKEWNYNRRVYSTPSGTLSPVFNSIHSNNEFFFKDKSTNDKNGFIGFTGFYDGVNRTMFSSFVIERNGQVQPIKLIAFEEIEKGTKLRDTIVSEWFDVNGDNELHFILQNNTLLKNKVKLQRENDNRMIELPKLISERNILKQGSILKTKSRQRVRLVFTDSRSTNFTQELVLGNFNQQGYGKTNLNTVLNSIIDLDKDFSQEISNNGFNLIISPNPTSSIVRVFAELPNNVNKNNITVKYVFTDFIGRIIGTKESRGNELVEFDLENYETGSYLIKAEYLNSITNELIDIQIQQVKLIK